MEGWRGSVWLLAVESLRQRFKVASQSVRNMLSPDSSLEFEEVPQGLTALKTRLSPELTRVGFLINKNSAYRNPQTYKKFLEVGQLTLEAENRPGTTAVKNKKIKALLCVYTGEWLKKSKLFHGIGSVVYFDGQIFEGHFENGERKGYGRLIALNGDLLEGTWDRGQMTGSGQIHTLGKRYKGETDNQLPHGQGTIRLKNGIIYEGSFQKGLMHGKGVLKRPGAYTYIGDFSGGLMQGKGRFEWLDGRVYEGDVADNDSNGKGILTWLDGQRYQGNFVNGRRTGLGLMIYTDKSIYEGDWLDDLRHGQGTLTLLSGTIRTGIWVNDRLEGGEEAAGNVSFSQSSIAREEEQEDDLPEVVARLNQQKWQGGVETSMGSLDFHPEKDLGTRKPPETRPALPMEKANVVPVQPPKPVENTVSVTVPSLKSALRAEWSQAAPPIAPSKPEIRAETTPRTLIQATQPVDFPKPPSLSPPEPLLKPIPVLKTLQDSSPKPSKSPQFLDIPLQQVSHREAQIGDFGFQPVDLDTGLQIPGQTVPKTWKAEEVSSEEAVSWKRPVLPVTSLFANPLSQGRKSHASESEESFLSYALRGREKEPSEASEGGAGSAHVSSPRSASSQPLPEVPHFLNDLTPVSGFAPLQYVLAAVVETWKLLPLFPFAALPLEPEPPTVVMKWTQRDDAFYRGYLDADQLFAGFGVLLTRDSITEGQWTNGELNGLGRRVTLNSILTGYWEENALSGFGTCFDLRAKSLYSGDWRGSQPEGLGCLSSSTQLYQGSFQAGQKAGHGHITTAELEYEGEFQAGEISGFGRAVLKDGAQYVGLWTRGVPQGLGVHCTADRKLFYGDHAAGKGVNGRYLVQGERMKAI